MWFLNKPHSPITTPSQLSLVRAYFSWLWKSRIFKYAVIIYVGFSIVFSSTHLVKQTFEGTESEKYLGIETMLKPVLRTYGNCNFNCNFISIKQLNNNNHLPT